MFPSLRLVTWFGNLVKLTHITPSCFHSLKAVISPYAQTNAFPVYVKAIHTALPQSFESVFWGTAAQCFFCESNLLCHYIVCRYVVVLFYCVDLGRSQKAHKLESNWFPAEALLLPSPLCSPGESLQDFVKEEEEDAVVFRAGADAILLQIKGYILLCFLLISSISSHRSWAHLILCLHQLPTTPTAQFHICLTTGSLRIYCGHRDTSKANTGNSWNVDDEYMLDGKNTSCRGSENHVSGANSQIRHPRHFLLDVPPAATASSVYTQDSPVTFINGKKHGRQRPQAAR